MSRNAAAIERACDKIDTAVRSPMHISKLSASHGELVVRLFKSERAARTVAFASVLPGEGVTYVVQHLATEIQTTIGLRVGIITGAELLSREPAILGVSLAGSALATRGSGRPTPGDGDTRLSQAGRDADVVLVDAGSVGGGGCILGVAGSVDAVVLVVEAGRTRRDDVTRTLATIAMARGQIAGVILNKYRTSVPAWIERLFS